MKETSDESAQTSEASLVSAAPTACAYLAIRLLISCTAFPSDPGTPAADMAHARVPSATHIACRLHQCLIHPPVSPHLTDGPTRCYHGPEPQNSDSKRAGGAASC